MAINYSSNGSIKFPVKSNFFLSVGYLASDKRQTKLDAELPENAQFRFETEYQNMTGMIPKPDNINYFILHRNADKWGIELRIYFISNEDLPSYLKNRVVKSRPGDVYKSRINENDFIWKLIRYGFRLSDVQDVQLIKSKIPKTYENDFIKGLSI